MAKVDLGDQIYTFQGKHIGPGIVDIPSQEDANDLKASVRRLKTRNASSTRTLSYPPSAQELSMSVTTGTTLNPSLMSDDVTEPLGAHSTE